MDMLGTILTWTGLVISFIGGLWLLILVFSSSILLGIASIFCNIIPIIWGFMNWSEAKIPLLLNFGGAGLMVIGILITGEVPFQ